MRTGTALEPERLSRGLPRFGLVAALFLIGYTALTLLQQALIGQEYGLVPFNIAVGFAVAMVARGGRAGWLALPALQFVVTVPLGMANGQSAALALCWSVVLTGQTAGVGIVLASIRRGLEPRWEALAALAAAAIGSALVGAGLAAVSLLALTQSPVGPAWSLWCVGTAAGIALAAPTVLVFHRPRQLPRTRRVLEVAASSIMGAILVVVIMGLEYANSMWAWGALYLLMPLLLWFAARFGLSLTALAFCVVNVATLTAAFSSTGPFSGEQVGLASALAMEVAIALIGLAIYGVAVNEDQRRSSDMRLLAAHGLVDSLLVNSDAMISVREYTDDAQGRYTLANPRFAQAMGSRVQDIVGRTEHELFTGTEADRVIKEDLRVLASRRSQVFVSRSAVGHSHSDARGGKGDANKVYLITKFPVVGPTGSTRSVGSIALDITEHRRREKLMRLTFDQSPVPIVRMAWRDGQAGEILDANLSVGELFGVPAASLIGSTLDRFTHPDEQSVSLVPRDGDPGQARRREARLVRADREDLWVAVTATVVEPTDVGAGLDRLDDAFALVILEDVTARRVAEQTLTHQALHDALTGVLNRYALIDRLEAALNRLWRDTACIAVLFCDMDGFKNLNDTLGHRAGDQMLVSVSERLRAVMRPQDTVARLGGDEFVMVCEDLPSPGQARVIGERIREAMRAPFRIDNREYGVTVSVGISTTADPQTRAEDLLRRADLAMYRAKDNGRNRVEYYVDELETKVIARVEATETLRRAITEDRICLHYQPIVDLKTLEIVGVEALARLIDEEGRLIQPSTFIGVAESSGLVTPLGERVLDIALDQLMAWADADLDLQLNVNVSPRQLARAAFAPAVFERLMTRGLAPKSLCLEVTEGAVVDATGPTLITLRRLRSYGVHVGIDDFGTGYSSLTTLKYLPADVLKVDRSFVEGLGSDPNDRAIVGAVVRVAHDLNRIVVAEGVESEQQADILREMGCDQVQGYRYGRPVPAAQITAMLNNSVIAEIDLSESWPLDDPAQ